jgi:hypothetical protein
MVCWLDPRRRPDAERVARLAATVRFALAPAAGEPEAPSDPAAPAAGEGAR